MSRHSVYREPLKSTLRCRCITCPKRGERFSFHFGCHGSRTSQHPVWKGFQTAALTSIRPYNCLLVKSPFVLFAHRYPVFHSSSCYTQGVNQSDLWHLAQD